MAGSQYPQTTRSLLKTGLLLFTILVLFLFSRYLLIKFNSRHNREAKSLYKTVSVQIPRPLRIPESGEITNLSSFPKAVFLPFTVVLNGLATIVATQSLQLGTVSANSFVFDSDLRFSRSYLLRNYCCSDFLLVFFQNGGFCRFSEMRLLSSYF